MAQPMPISYESIKHISKGSYGNIYHVRKVGTTEEYALKVNTVGTESYQETSIREIDILNMCQVHPKIVRVSTILLGDKPILYHHSNDDKFRDDSISVVMELAEMDLEAFINKGMIEDEKTLLRILSDILMAIEYLHNNNLIHRDIKPNNILLFDISSKDRLNAKLIDFSLCRPFTKRCPMTPVSFTSWFRPYECFRYGRYEFRSDIWSLGCVIYQMITYEYLFKDCETIEQLNAIYRNITVSTLIAKYSHHRSWSKTIIEQLAAMTMACLNIEVNGRPTATELLMSPLFSFRSSSIEMMKQISSIPHTHKLLINENRSKGCEQILKIVHTLRGITGFNFFKVQQAFLAVSLLDRWVVEDHNDRGDKVSSTIAIRATIIYYIAIKYYNTSEPIVSLNNLLYLMGMENIDMSFTSQFHSYMIHTVCGSKDFYRMTPLEALNNFDKEIDGLQMTNYEMVDILLKDYCSISSPVTGLKREEGSPIYIMDVKEYVRGFFSRAQRKKGSNDRLSGTVSKDSNTIMISVKKKPNPSSR